MNVREAAQQYIDHGWEPVPLRPISKKCIHDDWLTRAYSADDFADDSNIGIKQTKGLTDIDLDCAEAVFMAEAFQPRTRAIYGRQSHPRSHWLYRCPDLSDPLAFRDLVEQKNLLEVRVKHQSMAPPSIHPEGEAVEWVYPDHEAMVVEKPLLLRSAKLTATGAMVCRYYNPPGARHDWGLALGGFLRTLGLTEHEAVLLMTRAAEWARDDKVKDRLDAIRSTYGRAEDAPKTGGNALSELIGENGDKFIATIHRIWGEEGRGISKPNLERMNEKHAVLFDQGGNLMVITETSEDGHFQLRFSDPQTIAKLYPEPVQVGVTAHGKPITKSLGAAWFDHPKRRFYSGIELAPSGKTNPGYYNLWRGFSVEPKKGDWSRFRDHLLLVANDNEDHARYILTWLAKTVQDPGRPIGLALAFKGNQGTGKSTFAKWFGSLFGTHFLHLDSEHRLLGNFNAHLQNSIVVLADEAVWAGGKQGLGALKRMITEDTLIIERKGFDVIKVKNMLHMLIASNEEWVVPRGFDDRRFAIFGTSDKRRKNTAFFAAVRRQLFEQGGLGALLYDLLEHRSDIDLNDIPETAESMEQKHFSAASNESWWLEKLHAGALITGLAEWPEQVSKDALHDDYIVFLNKHRKGGRSSHATGTQLGIFLKKRTPLTDAALDGQRVWRVPPLVQCREAWRKACKWPSDFDWGDGPVLREASDDDIPF
jgi:hypothetical protein